MKFTAQQFEEMTGFPPFEDDLERLNCDQAGEIGHGGCGFCPDHKKPRFVCGCFNMDKGRAKCKRSQVPNTSR